MLYRKMAAVCCKKHKEHMKTVCGAELLALTFWRRNYFFNFSTSCIYNVNNTGTK